MKKGYRNESFHETRWNKVNQVSFPQNIPELAVIQKSEVRFP